MTDARVIEYAIANGLSNRQAKRRLHTSRKHRDPLMIARGAPVAGTGKPKGAAKG